MRFARRSRRHLKLHAHSGALFCTRQSSVDASSHLSEHSLDVVVDRSLNQGRVGDQPRVGRDFVSEISTYGRRGYESV
jgi:hypothetical protein